jgi:hypothetical protein
VYVPWLACCAAVGAGVARLCRLHAGTARDGKEDG